MSYKWSILFIFKQGGGIGGSGVFSIKEQILTAKFFGFIPIFKLTKAQIKNIIIYEKLCHPWDYIFFRTKRLRMRIYHSADYSTNPIVLEFWRVDINDVCLGLTENGFAFTIEKTETKKTGTNSMPLT